MKNIIVSWSSGKDSTLTLERLMDSDQYNVVGLFTTYLEDEVPFQATPIEVVEMQADLLGLPLVKIALPEVFPSNEQYKSLVVEGLKASDLIFEAVAFGDMFCNGIAEYRRSYIIAQVLRSRYLRVLFLLNLANVSRALTPFSRWCVMD